MSIRTTTRNGLPALVLVAALSVLASSCCPKGANIKKGEATKLCVPKGIDMGIVHVERRVDDAMRLKERLEQSGFTVKLFTTSDEGNATYEGHVYSETRNKDLALGVRNIAADIEPVEWALGSGQWPDEFEEHVIRIWIVK